MIAFIPYFWENDGFQYDPTRQYLFGWYHIAMMILMIGIFAFLWFLAKKKVFRNNGKLLVVISIVLIVLEVLRIINFHYVHNYTWFNSVTFHMCSFGVYLSVITGIFQKKWMFDATYLLAIIGAPLAIIIPFGILPHANDFSFIPLQSNISHLLITYMMIHAIKNKLWEVRLKRFYIGVLSITIITISIHLINLFKLKYFPGSYSNFFWTRYPDPLFPIINEWSFPYHILLIYGLFVLFGFFAYLIGEKHRLIKNIFLKKS
jgi:uncharacterized membrane protein YwaF